LIVVVLAYLIGSLSFGVILGYALKGYDIRARDLPGGSGVFRQLGPRWGVVVALSDIAKGALVAWLAQGRPELPWMAAAVVAGHNWPVYFGFRGGGGLAPTVGFFTYFAPVETLSSVAFGLLVAYWHHRLYWRYRRRGIYPIPFGAVVAVPLWLAWLWPRESVFLGGVLVALVMGARGLQLLLYSGHENRQV